MASRSRQARPAKKHCTRCGFFTYDARQIVACPYGGSRCPLVEPRPQEPRRRRLWLRAIGFIASTAGLIATMWLMVLATHYLR